MYNAQARKAWLSQIEGWDGGSRLVFTANMTRIDKSRNNEPINDIADHRRVKVKLVKEKRNKNNDGIETTRREWRGWKKLCEREEIRSQKTWRERSSDRREWKWLNSDKVA